MFRRTEMQRSLFEAGALMPEAKREACLKSWAGPFREKALPILLKREDDFAALYDLDNGRPNRSVALVVGTLLLKEMNDLTDEEALGALKFDVRWWYAFDLEVEDTQTCQKTLHNFRAGLMEQEKSRLVFRGLTDELISVLGIDTAKQRLDSTHILSNIALLSRLGTFCETLRIFVHALKKRYPKIYEALPVGMVRRYGEGSEYGDARTADRHRRLSVAARDTYRLVDRFKGDSAIRGLEEYHLLERLFKERCEVVAEAESPKEDDDDHGEGAVPVKLKEAKEVRSDCMQTPQDPDVTYSGHKGQGYEVQIAETCQDKDTPKDEKNPVQLITEVHVTPSAHSDARSTIPTIEALDEAGHRPATLLADTAYSGAENAAKSAEKGVNLLAPCPAKGKPDPQKTYPVPAPQCPQSKPEAGVWLKQQEAQPQFKKEYALRSGIEGTNSELKRGSGLGKLRVRGGERVELVVYFKAAGCNLKRAMRYWLTASAMGRPLPTIA
jgi:hypothetical protein